MMSKTVAVPAVATTPANLLAAACQPNQRPLFAPRPRRLATGPVPAAFILLVWVLLWTWVSVGVAGPLSRMGSPEPARVVGEASPRA
ncbi:MAG TPA: hypothetical protein VEP68_09040 [Anaeromyxobacteraceae bacterium]|nr:hypothetical protein [Anaeromyxobacteraceae bacterium]